MKIFYDVVKKIFGGDTVGNGFRKFSVCVLFSFVVCLLFFIQFWTTKQLITDVVFAGLLGSIITGFYATNTIAKKFGKECADANKAPDVSSTPPPSDSD